MNIKEIWRKLLLGIRSILLGRTLEHEVSHQNKDMAWDELIRIGKEIAQTRSSSQSLTELLSKMRR